MDPMIPHSEKRAAQADGDRVIVFDTTLRDGEQAPGASMDLEQKLEVARALQALGVDVLEAGFPAASPGDYEAVAAVARHVEVPPSPPSRGRTATTSIG